MKKGFTLSEVLLTLVIIGIVAAFTIPSIVNYTKDIELKSKAKKTYAMLSQAMVLASLDGFQPDLVIQYNSDKLIKQWFDRYFAKNLSVMKTCVNSSGCWNSGDTYYLKGGTVYTNKTGIGVGNNILTAVLNDGTFINIDGYASKSMKERWGIDVGDGNNALIIIFDVNGDKKPNTFGRDIYGAVFDGKTLIPPFRDYPEKVKTDCSRKGTGYSCLYKLVEKGSNLND